MSKSAQAATLWWSGLSETWRWAHDDSIGPLQQILLRVPTNTQRAISLP